MVVGPGRVAARIVADGSGAIAVRNDEAGEGTRRPGGVADQQVEGVVVVAFDVVVGIVRRAVVADHPVAAGIDHRRAGGIGTDAADHVRALAGGSGERAGQRLQCCRQGADQHARAVAGAGTGAGAIGADGTDVLLVAERQRRTVGGEQQVLDVHLQRHLRPVGDLALDRVFAHRGVERQAQHLDVLRVLELQLGAVEGHRRVVVDRLQAAVGVVADLVRLVGIGDAVYERDVGAVIEELRGAARVARAGIDGRVGADVGQLRVVVHEVHAQLGAAVEPFRVVLQGDAELVGEAEAVGLAVLQALDVERGVGETGQRVVEQAPGAVLVLRRTAEADRHEVAGVVGAEVGEGEVGTRRRDLHRLPFELVVGLDGGALEGLEAAEQRGLRGEHLFHREAGAQEVVGVDRLRLVDRVDHQQGGLAPVDGLAAELPGQLLLQGQRRLAVDHRVEQLQALADLAERRVLAALALHHPTRTVDDAAGGAGHRVAVAAGLGIVARQAVVVGGRGNRAHVEVVLAGDAVGVVLGEVVVDEVVEVDAAREEAEVAVAEREVLRELQRRLGEVVATVVEIAVVEVVGERTRHFREPRRRIALGAEQALAGLVQRAPVGQAPADVGIEIGLADQVRRGLLHAHLHAGGDGGIEHRVDAVLAEGHLELDGGRRSRQNGQGDPQPTLPQIAAHALSPQLRSAVAEPRSCARNRSAFFVDDGR